MDVLVELRPYQNAAAATAVAPAGFSWPDLNVNLWRFNVILREPLGEPIQETTIGSCAASNVSRLGNSLRCSFSYDLSLGLIVDPRFGVELIYAGRLRADGVLVAPSATVNIPGSCQTSVAPHLAAGCSPACHSPFELDTCG